MPTFIIFRSGKVLQTLRGADPRGLTSAVESAVRLAATMKQNYSYSSVGHTLGGPSAQPRQSLQQPWTWKWDIKGWYSAIITFLGLYFISLFSVSFEMTQSPCNGIRDGTNEFKARPILFSRKLTFQYSSRAPKAGRSRSREGNCKGGVTSSEREESRHAIRHYGRELRCGLS